MSDSSLPPTAPIGSSSVQVCLMEDDLVFRELVTILLAEANIEVQLCPLGWDAHHCIQTTLPKVVILDVHMPAVDGIKLFSLLRADPTTRHIPVIFLTAEPKQVRDEVPNYRNLAATIVPKPCDTEALLDLVLKAIAV